MSTNRTDVWLWVGVVFAGMSAATGLGMLVLSVLAGLGYIVVGAGIAVACGWPLSCRSQDKKALVQWQKEQATNRDLAQYLTEEDRTLLHGFDQGHPPAPVPRQWKKVAIVSAVLVVVGLSMTMAGFYSIGMSTTTGVYAPT